MLSLTRTKKHIHNEFSHTKELAKKSIKHINYCTKREMIKIN